MNQYLKFLYEVYMKPRHLQSDFARYNAKTVAEAASRGHITSLLAGGIATNKWYITSNGVGVLVAGGLLAERSLDE